MSAGRILIVDGATPWSAEEFRQALGQEWELAHVTSGTEALEELKTQHFDILVLSLDLAGADTGRELLNEVRKNYARTLRFVLVAAANRDRVMQKVPGVHQVLTIPLDLSTLRNTVERALLVNRPQIGGAPLFPSRPVSVQAPTQARVQAPARAPQAPAQVLVPFPAPVSVQATQVPTPAAVQAPTPAAVQATQVPTPAAVQAPARAPQAPAQVPVPFPAPATQVPQQTPVAAAAASSKPHSPRERTWLLAAAAVLLLLVDCWKFGFLTHQAPTAQARTGGDVSSSTTTELVRATVREVGEKKTVTKAGNSAAPSHNLVTASNTASNLNDLTPPIAPVQALVGDFRLQGIISSKRPSAIINGRMFWLNETLEDGVKLVEIGRTNVVIEQNGQRHKIFLEAK